MQSLSSKQLIDTVVPLAAIAALSGIATAQQQQICFTDTIPLTPTEWINESLTVSKFDPNLGILTGIDFVLEGTAEGSAAVESLDQAPSVATLTFQATLTLYRPDLSVIVIALPATQFVDNLTAYDGITDFGGTSGITHAGIQVMASEMASSPPPASDLVDFTGPAGNPGTITLPADGSGSSTGTGPGNAFYQFMTSASATLTVCYTYELDCNMNGIPDDEDLATGVSDDCNMNGIPDECELMPGLQYCFGNACPCGNDDPTAGCSNSSGAGGLLLGGGSASIASDDLQLFGTNLIPNQSALLFSADFAIDNCLGRTFGDGRRCAGVNLIRLGVELPDLNGNASYGPGLIALEDGPAPGDTRRYQIWYRDPSGPCGSGFNLTNGYAVTYSP